MSVCRDGARHVDKMQQTAAQEVTEGIGVVRQNDFGHLRLRACYRTNKRVCLSGTHCVFAPIFIRLYGRFSVNRLQWAEWPPIGGTQFQFRQSTPITQILDGRRLYLTMSTMDKIA